MFTYYEKEEAEICGGVRVAGLELERAAKSTFGDTELQDCPIVLEVCRFAVANRFREAARGFNDMILDKELGGARLRCLRRGV